jgi:hypothetical protein
MRGATQGFTSVSANMAEGDQHKAVSMRSAIHLRVDTKYLRQQYRWMSEAQMKCGCMLLVLDMGYALCSSQSPATYFANNNQSSNVAILLPALPLTPQGPSPTLRRTIARISCRPPSSSSFRPSAFNTSNLAMAT